MCVGQVGFLHAGWGSQVTNMTGAGYGFVQCRVADVAALGDGYALEKPRMCGSRIWRVGRAAAVEETGWGAGRECWVQCVCTVEVAVRWVGPSVFAGWRGKSPRLAPLEVLMAAGTPHAEPRANPLTNALMR